MFGVLPIYCFSLGLPSESLAESGHPVRIVGTDYPRLARVAKVDGRVEIIASIDLKGNVVDRKTVDGHLLLRSAVRESVSKWKFEECMAGGNYCEQKRVFSFVLSEPQGPECSTEFIVDLPFSITVGSSVLAPMID